MSTLLSELMLQWWPLIGFSPENLPLGHREVAWLWVPCCRLFVGRQGERGGCLRDVLRCIVLLDYFFSGNRKRIQSQLAISTLNRCEGRTLVVPLKEEKNGLCLFSSSSFLAIPRGHTWSGSSNFCQDDQFLLGRGSVCPYTQVGQMDTLHCALSGLVVSPAQGKG